MNQPSTMSLWRLEWLRLVRTKRIVALVGVYLFFGLTSPLIARYLGELMQRLGSGVQIVAPAPTPVDGFVTYTSNANQLGLLVFALVVSSAVAFDAQREMAVFLRTRVDRYRTLLLPKYVVPVLAGIAAYVLGTLACWYGSVIVLGSVDAVGVLGASFLGALYLAFLGAVAAALGSRLNSVLTTAIATLAVALLLGLLGTIKVVGDWLPSHLLGALTTLAAGAGFGEFVGPALVTVVLTAALLALAARLGGHREL